MKKFFSALAVVGCLLATHSANAGTIWFAGTVGGGAGGNWFMKVQYTPNGSAAAATTLSGTLELSGNTLNFDTVSVGGGTPVSPVLTISEGNPADQVSIVAGLTGTGGKSGILNSFYSPSTGFDIGTNPNATDANIQALTKVGTTVNGTVLNISGLGGAGPFNTITLTGSVVAPEPGSIALLSGLGLVVGRRLLKRRAKKQEAAV